MTSADFNQLYDLLGAMGAVLCFAVGYLGGHLQ